MVKMVKGKNRKNLRRHIKLLFTEPGVKYGFMRRTKPLCRIRHAYMCARVDGTFPFIEFILIS